MPVNPNGEIEELLDRCLDSLLRGENWEACVPRGHPNGAELLELMRVAERLVSAMGGEQPGGESTEERKVRTWGLMQRAIHGPPN